MNHLPVATLSQPLVPLVPLELLGNILKKSFQKTFKKSSRISENTNGSNSVPSVVESMQARKPDLQALSKLAGSKTKNTHIFGSIEFF